IGMRNMQKALLNALLQPNDKLAKLQNDRELTELLMLQEELKLYPVGDVWNYYCELNQVPQNEEWFQQVKDYEKQVLLNRI
ncbi:MAG: L-rhamnose isomerase, partial [Clostridiales bacterium]|nr:L-rhamnose isomerase [Clostridiales bacterium]